MALLPSKSEMNRGGSDGGSSPSQTGMPVRDSDTGEAINEPARNLESTGTTQTTTAPTESTNAMQQTPDAGVDTQVAPSDMTTESGPTVAVSSDMARNQVQQDEQVLDTISEQLETARQQAEEIQRTILERGEGGQRVSTEPERTQQTPQQQEGEDQQQQQEVEIPDADAAQNAYKAATSNIDRELNSVMGELDQFVTTMDNTTKNMVENIKQQYKIRRDELRDNLDAELEGVEARGIRSGRARFASGLQASIMSNRERAGLEEIRKTHTEENTAILEARQAQQEMRYKVMSDKVNTLMKLRSQKRQAIKDQFDMAMKKEQYKLDVAQEERLQEAQELDNQQQKIDYVAPTILNSYKEFDSKEAANNYIKNIAQETGVNANMLLGKVNELQNERDNKVRSAVLSMAQEYPDAGISPEDSLDEVQSKILSSPKYNNERTAALEQIEYYRARTKAVGEDSDETTVFEDPETGEEIDLTTLSGIEYAVNEAGEDPAEVRAWIDHNISSLNKSSVDEMFNRALLKDPLERNMRNQILMNFDKKLFRSRDFELDEAVGKVKNQIEGSSAFSNRQREYAIEYLDNISIDDLNLERMDQVQEDDD